ncbi:cupin domain-containing protein [Flagellimonas meishanensis]|uniref:cupin domain-containing protein n=1 Tax=Flagellimonas meishanensis TaxID=2873264 RepID=UPI001CA73F97|nr:cupin domain-containing protein [[Muricauda] meishanensis]
MDTKIEDYVVNSDSVEWRPLKENGIDTKGIYIKALRYDKNGRPPSFLLRFEEGANYPYHNHPAGEELFVLEGTCIIEGAVLKKGDYLYTPPSFKHSVKTETGCVLYFIVPEEVEILE